MTKEYLKMAGVFPDNFNIDEIMVYNRESRKFNNDTLEECVLHAINSHDELVAEVERLRGKLCVASNALDEVDRVISERIKNGAYDLDDISSEVLYALEQLSKDTV